MSSISASTRGKRSKPATGADWSTIAQLANRLQRNPTLAEHLAERAPQTYEQVLRVASFPLLRWSPFGQTMPDGNPCQVGLLSSRARHRWAVCGNRTGKTESGLAEDAADANLLDPITKGPSTRFKEPPHIWIVSETEEASIEIIQRKFADEILGPPESFGWNLVADETKYNARSGFGGNTLLWTNGARIDFKYCSAQRMNQNAFAGRKVHKVHFDEQPYKEVYSECYARTIDYEGYLLGTMTPIYDKTHGMPWVYQELYVPRERKRIEFHTWSLFHNPHLSETAKQQLIDEWDDDEMDARAFGMFTPIGLQVAFARGMIRELRQHTERPRRGELYIDERGQLVFDETVLN